MEERKLIKLGKTSTVISLPTTWLVQRKLKSGDRVYLDFIKDGSLSVRSSAAGSAPQMTIKVDESLSQVSLEKLIIAAYLNGADKITIESQTKFTKKQVETIHKMVANLMGMELIDESSNQAMMQCFLAEDLPVDRILPRMRAMIKSFFTDLNVAFVKKDLELLRGIPERDWGVNKLHHFAKRQLYKMLVSPKDMTLRETIFYIGLVDKYERIADYLKKIAIATDKTGVLKTMSQKEFAPMFDILGEVLSNFEKISLAISTGEVAELYPRADQLDELGMKIAAELDKLVVESGGKREVFKRSFFDNTDRIRGYARLVVDETTDILLAGKSGI